MKKFLTILTIIALALFFILFGYIRLGAYFTIDKEVRQEIVSVIKNSPALPTRFYELYEVAYPGSLSTGLTENVVRKIINSDSKEVPSYYVSYYLTYSWGVKIRQMTYFIEDQTTQKECLNAYAHEMDFTKSNKGIEEASQFYFKKSLGQCSDREMMTLIVMMQNPSLYDPFHRLEKVEEAVDKMMERLEEK